METAASICLPRHRRHTGSPLVASEKRYVFSGHFFNTDDCPIGPSVRAQKVALIFLRVDGWGLYLSHTRSIRIRQIAKVIDMYLTKNEFFEAIRLARPLLIIFICIAHIPDIKGYVSSSDQWQDIGSLVPVFILDVLVRGAVPILTAVSGYLAYYSYQKRAYLHLVREKSIRLLWPYIVWNFIAIFVYWLVFYSLDYEIANVSNIVDNVNAFATALLGLNLNMPINVSTYFVRDLFVIILCIPVIDLLARYRSLTAMALLSVVVVLWQVPSVVINVGEFKETILFRVDMIFFFILGYRLARNKIQPKNLSSAYLVLSIAFMTAMGTLISMSLSYFEPSPAAFNRLRLFMGVFFVLMLPAIFKLLILSKKTKMGALLSFLSPYAFTLFLSHIVITQLFQYVFWHLLSWKETESAPLLLFISYLISYVGFLVLAAILIRHAWLGLQSILNKLPLTSLSSRNFKA